MFPLAILQAWVVRLMVCRLQNSVLVTASDNNGKESDAKVGGLPILCFELSRSG